MPKLTIAQLIDGLNSDLAGELQAIIQYLQHAYHVVGPYREHVHDILEGIAKDEMKHAEELAERIEALGGVPTVKPKPIKQAETIPAMLELNLAAEKQALKDYYERRDQTEKMGEIGTALIIENIIVDEQHHHDKLIMMLRKEKAKK